MIDKNSFVLLSNNLPVLFLHAQDLNDDSY